MRSCIITCISLIGIGALIFLFIIVSSDTEFHTKWYGSSVENIPLTYAESQIASKKSEADDILAFNKAIEQQKLSLCNSIVKHSKKSECNDMVHAIEAQTTNSIDTCKLLTDQDRLNRCLDNITIDRAGKMKDKALCAEIKAKNLKIYCENEIDIERLKTAQEKSTLSPEFCASFTGNLADDCARSLARVDNTATYADALEKKDPTACDDLSEESFRNTCHDAIILQIALSEKNPDFCDSIHDITKKSYCETALNTTNDSKRFQEIVATGDIAQCNIFTEKRLQYQCSDMITMAIVRTTHDQNLCGNLFNAGMQFACMQIANASTK